MQDDAGKTPETPRKPTADSTGGTFILWPAGMTTGTGNCTEGRTAHLQQPKAGAS